MKTFIYSLLLFGVVLFLANSCKEDDNGCPASFFKKHDDRVVVKNNHPFEIVHQFSFRYPDTLIDNLSDPITVGSESNKTLVSGESDRLIFNACWENIFSREINSDTLLIFSYSLDSLNLKGWEHIESQYVVLDRKAYSLQDLKNNNWLIELP
ncbi:hypothetical protein G3O08_20040 [Cryomorpha ignava]|uniref:Uncharacterized protein n=1 Tax=Cryomorpha ignava TaxID=101383 RepID=A0A7K3WYM7_9FLAO|nr:hypothetical protein [Cryomorpha ignava]NEN25785.1 hypothetical protein [Cryomorpha ignava]